LKCLNIITTDNIRTIFSLQQKKTDCHAHIQYILPETK
jgi:hypothetical protein